MSAMLKYNSAGRAMVFLANDQKPWWWEIDTSNRGIKDVGYLQKDQVTANEALEIISAGDDFCYDVVTPEYNGKEIEGYRFVIDRMSDKVISVVSDKYQVQQPREFADVIDGVFSNTFVVDTFGAIDGGRKLFCSTRVGESSFRNKRDDVVIRMMTVVGSCDYSTPFAIVLSSLRTVCYNTFTPQLHMKRAYSAQHRTNMVANIKEIQRKLELVDDYYESLEMLMRRLAEEKIRGTDDIKKFAVGLFEIDRESSQATKNRAVDMMNFANREAKKYGYDRAALLNGVTELVSHPERRKTGPAVIKESILAQEVRLRGGMESPLVNRAVKILCQDNEELKELAGIN